jgi:hypothetical protein
VSSVFFIGVWCGMSLVLIPFKYGVNRNFKECKFARWVLLGNFDDFPKDCSGFLLLLHRILKPNKYILLFCHIL